MEKTDWLYVRNIVSKDNKFIFVLEDIYHRIQIMRVSKTVFGTFRNRRPWIRDQVKFHILNDVVVGFEIYRD